MTALGKDPAHLFPNTDDGRAPDPRLHATAASPTSAPACRAPSPPWSPGNLVIKRVPPEIEAGAPGGYAAAGTIDGTVPGNFTSTCATPRSGRASASPTLTFHEGIPGHVWQGEYTYRLPLVRSLLAFNAYSEGWALYAEQLGDELGVYDGDPLGRLGYLQSIAFRACRLVVDTGLHAKRWTREQAIQWFATTNGSTRRRSARARSTAIAPGPARPAATRSAIARSSACATRPGRRSAPRFDLRAFNDALVTGGNVPLVVLGRIIDAHIAARRG